MVKDGTISPADKIVCSSPIVVVKKKDKALRICVNFRKINESAVYNHWHLPVIKYLNFNSRKVKIFF